MKLKYLLLKFHLSCAYQYTYPIQWEERYKAIKNLIKQEESK